MDKKLLEELRVIYLKEADIEPELSHDTLSEAEKNAYQSASKVFENELYPLFYNIWADLWVNTLKIRTDRTSDVAEMWVVALHGLSIKDIAEAINEYMKSTTGKYPPNPLEFRNYCKTQNQFNDIGHETLEILN